MSRTPAAVSKRSLWLLLQAAVAYVVLFFVHVPFNAANMVGSDGGLASGGILLWYFIPPAWTVAAVIFAGLPIRIGGARSWWWAHLWLAPLGIVIGTLLVLASWHLWGADITVLDDLGRSHTGYVPHFWIFLAGWFILAFSVTHTWLPSFRRRRPSAAEPRLSGEPATNSEGAA